MSEETKKLIVKSYVDNILKFYVPKDLYFFIFKYYNAKKPIYFDKNVNRYKFKITLIGDQETGKSNILLRYVVCTINTLNQYLVY